MKCILIVIFMYAYVIWCKDLVSPNNEEISHVRDNNSTIITEHNTSVSNDQCPKDMLWQTDFGVCDCKPRFLYFAANDSCYEAYKQGPCPLNHYFVLPENETTSRCVKNPCLEDGMVLYNNTCYSLGIHGPCAPGEVLWVNTTTFKVECIRTSITPFIIIEAPKRPCPQGTRRNKLKICKEVI